MKTLPTSEQVIEAVKKGRFTEARRMSETLEEARAQFLQAVSYMSLGLDGVKMWLYAGIDVNVRDEKTGRTALHVAMANGNMEAAGLLIAYGANPLICDVEDQTPMNLAASDDIWNVAVKALVARKQRSDAYRHSLAWGAPGSL